MNNSRRVYGLIGFPVDHSLSPVMQNAAFRDYGFNAHYGLFPVRHTDLKDALRGAPKLGIVGLNVTSPHKQAAQRLVDCSNIAESIGAVNTLVWQKGRWFGHNTDAVGLTRALEEADVNVAGKRVLILGAGGAARATVASVRAAGALRVSVMCRRFEEGEDLVNTMDSGTGRLVRADWADRDAFGSADILIQATPGTMGPTAERFVEGLPIDCLPGDAVVMDLVYKPIETALIKACDARGLTTVDGLGMLLHQGAAAFELWTRKEAPLTVMRRALVGVIEAQNG